MTRNSKQSARHTPIVTRNIDGYRVHILDDGTDYIGLVRKFNHGQVAAKRLNNPGKHRRMVHLVEVDGRKYVIKIDPRPGNEWTHRMWQVLVGARDSSLMRRINRAVDEGCDVAPRTFFVAERIRGRLVTETVVIHEYIEGRPVDLINDPPAVRREIVAAMEKLYSYRIAHTDISPNNFLVTDSGVKIIDLTFRCTFLMGRIKGMVRLKRRFKVNVPPRTPLDRPLMACIEGKETWNRFWRAFGRRWRAFLRKNG